MNPRIWTTLSKHDLRELKHGKTVQYPHTIDDYLFGGHLDISGWPDLAGVNGWGVPAYTSRDGGCIIGRLTKIPFKQRVEDRASDWQKARQVSFVLADKELEVREEKDLEWVREMESRGHNVSPIYAQTYVLDRRALLHRVESQEELERDRLVRATGLSLTTPTITFPNQFIINYFRSAQPLAHVLDKKELHPHLDVIITVGTIDKTRTKIHFF